MRITTRREFIQAAGAALMSASLPTLAGAEESWSSGTERPAFRLPEGAIDCHMHIYDDRFPVAPGTTLRPQNATVAQYRLLQARLGVGLYGKDDSGNANDDIVGRNVGFGADMTFF